MKVLEKYDRWLEEKKENTKKDDEMEASSRTKLLQRKTIGSQQRVAWHVHSLGLLT
jgi:hypothetical protein